MLFSVTILVVLGCHIQHIQNGRLSKAIEFAEATFHTLPDSNSTNSNVMWFLTGGVKNALTDYISKSEAASMNDDLFEEYSNIDDNVVLDTTAKNTAENFANLKKWLLKHDISDSNIVITTSQFHKNRAEKIFEGIFYDVPINPIWNLSSDTCNYCSADEHIHIKNVKSDVDNALSNLIKSI